MWLPVAVAPARQSLRKADAALRCAAVALMLIPAARDWPLGGPQRTLSWPWPNRRQAGKGSGLKTFSEQELELAFQVQGRKQERVVRLM